MKKGFAKFLLAVFHSDTFFFAVFLNRRLRTFFSGPVTERIKNYHDYTVKIINLYFVRNR